MTSRVRFSAIGAVAMVLSACASAPMDAPQAVKVKAGTVTPAYSSFNAKVLSDAAAVDNTFTASLDPQKETLTRLESSYAQDQVRVGDSVSSSGMWSRPVRYGGVQFGSAAGRSDVIDSQELATTGLAVLPTVADALFASVGDSSTALAPQKLSVERSLRPGGSSAWDLTARDTYGRAVAIDAPLIAQTRLAQPGCSDFSLGLGKVRRDYAIVSNDYGPLYANTTVVCGAPLGFTVEGHGEYLAEEVTALGLGIARPLGPLGTASVAVASSHADAGTGWLARVGFEHQTSMFNFMFRSRIQSREFREVGSTASADPIMQRNLASVGLNVAPGANFALAYAAQTTWSRERANLIAVKQSLSVGQGSVAMSAGHSLADNFGSSVFFSYKRPFGAQRVRRSSVEEFDLDMLTAPVAQ